MNKEKEKEELEKIIKDYAEKYNIKEFKVDIMDLYGGKKKVDLKVR